MKKITVCLFLLVSFTVVYGVQEEGKSLVTFEIKNGWKFKQADKDNWLPATVPGCIHTDLIDNKLIGDPFFGTNEKDLQWIGEKDWIYETTFDVSKELYSKKNIEMIFKGLDTYTKVYLNDMLILNADNMFREWNVDCKRYLLPEGNTLRIEFINVFSENMPKYNEAPYRLMACDNNDQADVQINMYSRKAGYHFGWDWGPRFVTYGIWKPIFIQAWEDVKLNDVFVVQKNVSKEKADINSTLEILSDENQSAVLELQINGEKKLEKKLDLVEGKNKIDVEFTLDNPLLWWTNGLGEQYLYKFNYKVITEKNSFDENEINIGIRSIELVREKDSIGTSFYFKINGIPVFAKGANYIPQDNFLNRVTPERYDHIIKSAADANMNMLRVWGGGVYGDDIFYDLCDKYGILVWQDLMFACAMYPADEKYLENIRGEVIDNVHRIRNHPSLAMYCGNNEIEVGWFHWGWKTSYSGDIQESHEADYQKIFYETIPNALAEIDPTRYYHPSSPSAAFGNYDYNNGDVHYWSVWHGKEPFEKYADNIGRFMSEYGFQSYPEMNAIKKFTNPEDRDLHSEVMLSHQRCMADVRKDKEYGNRLVQWYMDRMYNQPDSFEKYLYVAQLVQAEGIKAAIEAHRRNMPKCMGTMYWQIDDCWPVASWSSIDYYGNWKALHYFVRDAYKQILISPVLNDKEVDVFVVSDKLESISSVLEITTYNFSGKQISKRTIPLEVAPNTSKKYFSFYKKGLIKSEDEDEIFVLFQLKENDKIIAENKLFFVEPKDLELEESEIQKKIVKTSDGYQIELTANKFAKNVFLSLDESYFFSDNYFDLLPGVPKTVELKTGNEIVDIESKLNVSFLIN
jgi:beta-mannosidase